MTQAGNNNLEKHSLLLLVAAQVANVCGLLFHMLLGGSWVHWSLDENEYQVLVFMLNTIMIALVPMDAIRSMVSHYSSLMAQQGHYGDVYQFSRLWRRRMVWVGLSLGVTGTLCAPVIVSVFNIDRPMTFTLTMWTLAVTLFMPLYAGFLQGVQAFFWFSMVYNLWAVVRLLLGVGLVYFAASQAFFGILGQLIGMLLTVLVGFFGIRHMCRGKLESAQPMPRGAGYLFKSVVILVGYAVLFNSDIHLVQYFLPDTGDMAAKAGTIARAVVFLPMPIALAMFPKVSSTGVITREDVKTLCKALVYVLLLLLALAGICAVKPAWPLLLLYGMKSPSPDMLETVRAYVIGMSPLSLTYSIPVFS